MTFYGREDEAPETAADKPLRTYTYMGQHNRLKTVEAHYLQFTAGHVNFWRSRPDNEQDTLVLSEANAYVHQLEEVVK